MERIIQLKESEYNKLQNAAEMKDSEITRKAQELYEEKGIYGVNLEINCQQDYTETIQFYAYSYVKDWNNKFPISESDKRRIVEFINSRVLRMMEKKFGRQIANINLWNQRLDLLRNWKMKFIGLTIFGWLAALVLAIISLVK